MKLIHQFVVSSQVLGTRWLVRERANPVLDTTYFENSGLLEVSSVSGNLLVVTAPVKLGVVGSLASGALQKPFNEWPATFA